MPTGKPKAGKRILNRQYKHTWYAQFRGTTRQFAADFEYLQDATNWLNSCLSQRTPGKLYSAGIKLVRTAVKQK